MTSGVYDAGRGSREIVEPDAQINDAKASADAGFRAGLCVVVEAFPSASVILDETCGVVAANHQAGALLDRLQLPPVRSEFDTAMDAARRTCSAVAVALDEADGGTGRFHVTALATPNGTDAPLFLVTENAHERADAGPVQPPLLQYELAPRQMQALREEAARFKRLSEADPLTGVLNIRSFAALANKALADAPRSRVALICLDLNNFKSVNDRFGHVAGDKILIHVASRLSFPSHTGILTARMGGDEFALWVPGVGPDQLDDVIQGIRDRLSVPVTVSIGRDERSVLKIKASIGGACCPSEALNYKTLRDLADQRLYEDKERFGIRFSETARNGVIKRKGAVDPAPQSFLPR